MSRQIQIELWPECLCNRCGFCNLSLFYKRNKDNGVCPDIVIPPREKADYIRRGINFLTNSINWDNYDELSLRGGEIFNIRHHDIEKPWLNFLEHITHLIFSEKITKLSLVTSLKYRFHGSLLQLTLEYLTDNGVKRDRLMVCTSWDSQYRFTNQALISWLTNISILKGSCVPYHITSILTEDFIQKFFNNDLTVKDIMKENIDFVPAQGKPELLSLNGFLPKRESCLKFLVYLKGHSRYYHIWERLLMRNHTETETVFSTGTNSLETRVRDYSSITGNTLPCGHPSDYANYQDSDACFLCDLKTLEGM